MKHFIPTRVMSTVLLGSTLLFGSCDKKNDPDPVQQGTAQVQISNKAGSESLVLGTGVYTNAAGNTFSVTGYKYYISNIELLKADGQSYKEEYSYHLIDEATASSKTFTLNNIPEGTYTQMRVVLGVDSTHNVSGAQTGDLDPILGMFWEWNTGYIMAKLEGTSPQSGNAQNTITFHLGGFSGQYNVVKTVILDLPGDLVIKGNQQSEIQVESNLLKWFTGSATIDFPTYHSVTSIGRDGYTVSENYKAHLSVSSVSNP